MESADRVRRLAALANLELTEGEVARYARDLPAAMAHMEAVLKAAGGSPGPWLEPAPGAPDTPRPSLPAAAVLGLAPATEDGHIMAAMPRGR